MGDDTLTGTSADEYQALVQVQEWGGDEEEDRAGSKGGECGESVEVRVVVVRGEVRVVVRVEVGASRESLCDGEEMGVESLCDGEEMGVVEGVRV